MSFQTQAAFGGVPLQWEVGYADTKEVSPAGFVKATVPGAVQLDIAASLNYPPYEFSDNYKQWSWMEDKFYTYKTRFKKPALREGDRLYFVSKGIDYQFEIYLNDQKVFEQEGMFTRVDVDLTGRLQADNELRILIHPVPKRHPSPVDRSQAAHVVKPPVSYGWDWHPRLVPLGIWDETGLEIRPAAFVNDVHVQYRLSPGFDKAFITLNVEGKNLKGIKYRWRLSDGKGRTVLEQEGAFDGDVFSRSGIVLDQPELWWPHDHGTPRLYASTLVLTDGAGSVWQDVRQKVGFRSVKLVMNEGAWDKPDDFPKGRSVPPAQFEVNGRRIFAKGTNWVNPEIFPGTITEERYRGLLEMAVDLNFNLLRVWGGGIVNKEAFFDICDEMGLMVWQEFPLACNNYPDDARYLSVLKREAASIIRRVRKHPCLALWCGGNELFNNWSGMTDQSLALRLLDSLCLQMDPHTPYNPTSPVMGMAHGNYVFRYLNGSEVYENMNKARYTAYTEFGMPGISPLDVLKKIIPENEMFPPRPGTAWQEHHAFGAWVGDTWLTPSTLEFYFGKPSDIEDIIFQSQWLQCEGYKAIYEEARRQKPYCAMALNWCYNEPWPAAVNNSLIAYPNVKKPAYEAVRKACRPVCASARIRKFAWNEGEFFTTDLFLLNDSFDRIEAGKMIVFLEAGGRKTEILRWDIPEAEANANVAGPTPRFRLPHWDADRFTLIVEVQGKPEYDSSYTLLYKPLKRRRGAGTPTLNVN